jgi:glutamate transport system permease protein
VSVLFEVPGPRARRATLIGSVAATAVILAGAYRFVYLPLAEKGQFSLQMWGPLVDPSHEYFAQVWQRLGVGAANTLVAAVLAIAGSLVFGTLLAVLRIQLRALRLRRFTGTAAPVGLLLRLLSRVLSAVTRTCVEVFRGLPVVITIFLAGRGLPELGVSFELNLWYVVIGLTVYNMVVIAEMLRSGMESLSGGQGEAAAALGLGTLRTTWSILLPQSFRIMLPALVGQLVVVLKDTSLGFIISYEETMVIAKQIIGNLGNPIQVYLVVGAGFVAANYVLSALARHVQRRVAERPGR